MDDGTIDDSVTMEVGVIEQLADRQLDVQSLIDSARDQDDKTMEEGLIANNLGYPDEHIVGMVLARLELEEDPHREPNHFDLMWAAGMLDHLDTLGFRLVRKR